MERSCRGSRGFMAGNPRYAVRISLALLWSQLGGRKKPKRWPQREESSKKRTLNLNRLLGDCLEEEEESFCCPSCYWALIRQSRDLCLFSMSQRTEGTHQHGSVDRSKARWSMPCSFTPELNLQGVLFPSCFSFWERAGLKQETGTLSWPLAAGRQ